MSLLSNIWFHSIFSKSGACFSIFQWCLLRSKFWILVSTVYQFLLSWIIVNEAFRKESLISVSITGGLSLHSDVCGDGCRPCEHMQEPRCPAVSTAQAASAPATTQGPWRCLPRPLLCGTLSCWSMSVESNRSFYGSVEWRFLRLKKVKVLVAQSCPALLWPHGL